MKNTIPAGRDMGILSKVLEDMTPAQRREWFILIKMAEKGKSYREMAAKHRVSPWYLSASVAGKYAMTGRIVRILEKDLEIDLVPFLSLTEAAKCGKTGTGVDMGQEEI